MCRFNSRCRNLLHCVSVVALLLMCAVNIDASASEKTRYQDIPEAYHRIANHFGVPVDKWFAILLQESGKQYQGRLLPWPWTLNVAGKSYRFNSKTEMAAFLRRTQPHELNKIDIGFGQIHWGSHKDQFQSVADLVEPIINLSYSAYWFKQQYAASNDWWIAVGKYHAPNNTTNAQKYRLAVQRHWRSF